MRPPKQIKILVDSREKKPLLFPDHVLYTPGMGSRAKTYTVKVKTERKTLPAGDYWLDGYNIGMERKGSITELYSNLLTGDVIRFRKALDRFVRDCLQPTLLLQVSPRSFKAGALIHRSGPGPKRQKIDGLHVWTRLLEEIQTVERKYYRRLSIFFMGDAYTLSTRRHMGALVAHTFIAYPLID